MKGALDHLPMRSTWQKVVGRKGAPKWRNLPYRCTWQSVVGRKGPWEWTRPASKSTWQRKVADPDGRSEARQEATIRAGCGGSPSMWERPGVGGLQRCFPTSSMHNDGDDSWRE